MSRIETISIVTVRFRAGHMEPFGAAPHEHDWTVSAGFAARPLVDGRERQRQLAELCVELQPDLNAVLGDQATNEGIAAWVLRRLLQVGCTTVVVERQAEGLSARAWVRGALG